MYVYTGEKMRGWPYRRVLVPSFGYRFPEMPPPAPPPMEELGTEPVLTQNVVSSSMPVNLVRVALLIAVGAVAWKLYESYRAERMVSNLPSWPGIGPLFNVGAQLGPAFSLGPYMVGV